MIANSLPHLEDGHEEDRHLQGCLLDAEHLDLATRAVPPARRIFHGDMAVGSRTPRMRNCDSFPASAYPG